MLLFFQKEKDFFLLYLGLLILKGDTVLKIFTEISIFDIIYLFQKVLRVYQEVDSFLEQDYSSLNTKNILLVLYFMCIFFFFNKKKKNNNVFGILYYYPHKESTNSILLRFSGVILIFLFFFYVFLFSSISFYGDKSILFFVFSLGVSLNTIFVLLHLYFITLHSKESLLKGLLEGILEFQHYVELKYLLIKKQITKFNI